MWDLLRNESDDVQSEQRGSPALSELCTFSQGESGLSRARPWEKELIEVFGGYMRRCRRCCNPGSTVLLASAARDGVIARPSRTISWYGALMSGFRFQPLVTLQSNCHVRGAAMSAVSSCASLPLMETNLLPLPCFAQRPQVVSPSPVIRFQGGRPYHANSQYEPQVQGFGFRV